QPDPDPAAGWFTRPVPPVADATGARLPWGRTLRHGGAVAASLPRTRGDRLPALAGLDAGRPGGRAGAALDMMTDTQVADAGFIVELERFQGPLDLLLHLIREQDIDIFDIPIARITEQFLKAIEGIERLGLDRAGEFLEMAATLIRIKAQMLLPRRVDEDGELIDPRADLVRRLLEYEHFREAARRLEEAEAERARLYPRGYVPPIPRNEQPVELEVTWDEVWAAALALGTRQRPPAEHRVTQRAVPLQEKIKLILDTLSRMARVEFRRLVAPFGDRLHAVVTLLAGLELAKQHVLAMRQREVFAPLWFYRRNGKKLDASDWDHRGAALRVRCAADGRRPVPRARGPGRGCGRGGDPGAPGGVRRHGPRVPDLRDRRRLPAPDPPRVRERPGAVPHRAP